MPQEHSLAYNTLFCSWSARRLQSIGYDVVSMPVAMHCQISNVIRPLVVNIIVDHSDVVEGAPVGAVLTIPWFSN